MKVKIDDLEIELEPGIALEVAPDGKHIRISAPPALQPWWTQPSPVIIREYPQYAPFKITWGSDIPLSSGTCTSYPEGSSVWPTNLNIVSTGIAS